MNPWGVYPEGFAIARRRAGGETPPRMRYQVVRERGNYHEVFWSFDDRRAAENLAYFLVAQRVGARVFDADFNKDVLRLKPASAT